jgi:peroxiredoxin
MVFRKVFLTVFMLMGLVLGASGPVAALEYPLQTGQQIIFDATTVGMGQPAMAWRYELWLLGEREPGKFEAVWVFYNNPRQQQESMAGAIPLTIDKKGTKQFPREREVTYILEEAVESFLPDLSKTPAFNAVWKGPTTVTGRYFSYQPVGEVNKLVRCSFAQYGEDKMDQVVGVLTTGEAFFDPAGNWLKEINFSTTKQAPQGQVIISQAVARLSKVVQKDEKWAAKRRDEAKAFFVQLAAHDDILYKANDNLASATLEVAPTVQGWQTFLAQNDASIFAPLARNHLQVMQAELPVLQTLWLSRKKVVGNPAPRWTLKDTAGTAFTLDSVASQPVLLLFWSRNSWESLMAIRELKEMKAAYEPRGLKIFPINLDQTDQEAVDALAALGANFTTLRNIDPNLLTVHGIPLGVLPSAVVIDRTKKVTDVHFGWGKRVFKDLRAQIEGAL